VLRIRIYCTLFALLLLVQSCRGASVQPDSVATPQLCPRDISASQTFSQVRSSPENTESPEPDQTCDIRRIEKLLKDAEQDFPGIFGASFQEIPGGLHCGVKEDRTFQAASIIKIPVMYELYMRSRAGLIDLDETVTVNESDYVDGGGVMKNQPGRRSYRLRELGELMITKSDNTATDLLIKRLGMDEINSTMKKAGLDKTSVKRLIFDFDAVDRGLDNLTTPRDIRTILLSIHNEQKRDAASTEMLDILKRVERRDMIPSGLPDDIPVAHKTGELSGVLLDTAIIYLKEKPYILCLMGEEIRDRDGAVALFAALSKKIYAEMK